MPCWRSPRAVGLEPVIALDWIKARLVPALLAALAGALLFGAVQSYRIGSLKRTIGEITAALGEARTAYAVLKARIVDRTAEAERQDAANVERVKIEQTAITEDRVNAYRNRIDALNARVAELRGQAARGGVSGGGAAASMPAASAAPGRADGTACCDRFPLELRALATKQAIQLEELQLWVKSQGQVDNSGEVSSAPQHPSEIVPETAFQNP